MRYDPRSFREVFKINFASRGIDVIVVVVEAVVVVVVGYLWWSSGGGGGGDSLYKGTFLMLIEAL